MPAYHPSLTKRLAPVVFDIVVVVVIIIFSVAQLMIGSTEHLSSAEGNNLLSWLNQIELNNGTIVLLILYALPLLLRRKFPRAIWVITLLLYLITQLAHDGQMISVAAHVVALYTLASRRPRRETFIFLLISVTTLLFASMSSESLALTFLVQCQNIAMVVAAAALGDALRSRQTSLNASETRIAEAERAQEELTRRRVEEERVRIAREVHDITAHSLSAITLQAAVAERLVDKDRVSAKEAIHVVRVTSKEALDELRVMVGVLREPNHLETAPTATTQRLDELVSYLKNAGLEVTLDTSGYDRDAIPTYLDVAIFRIAREAATNIVRHADASHALIRLVSDEQAICLTVKDDGRGSGSNSIDTESGHGIIGMRERATALGGTLTTTSSGSAQSGDIVNRLDGRTADDIAFGGEPFNAEALGVSQPDSDPKKKIDEKTGFTVQVTIPIQPRGGTS